MNDCMGKLIISEQKAREPIITLYVGQMGDFTEGFGYAPPSEIYIQKRMAG